MELETCKKCCKDALTDICQRCQDDDGVDLGGDCQRCKVWLALQALKNANEELEAVKEES